MCASPLFKVTSESTLFTKLLGYQTYTGQNMLQLPGTDRTDLLPWLADNDEMIKRTKAVEFHCPSLVTSSYNQDGKQSGGSLAHASPAAA